MKKQTSILMSKSKPDLKGPNPMEDDTKVTAPETKISQRGLDEETVDILVEDKIATGG